MSCDCTQLEGAGETQLIYSVRHTTTFRYDPAIRESIMEVRLQPRSEGDQRCLSFRLNVDPAANVMHYRDFTGNTVHHFDIAGSHNQVKVTANSSVEIQSGTPPRAPIAATGAISTHSSRAMTTGRCSFPATSRTPATLGHAGEGIELERRGNPLMLLTELNESIYNHFNYVPTAPKWIRR